MAEKTQVKWNVEGGVILLTVHFNLEFLLERGAGERLSKELTALYREIREKEEARVKTTSCIVEIQAEVAGSALVRALFELWKEVRKEGGKVVCVNYPQDYIDSLTSLGILALKGFSLADTKAEAIRKLTRK